MGDMADMAIDNAFNDIEEYGKYCDEDLETQYEHGIIDESGATIGNPGHNMIKK